MPTALMVAEKPSLAQSISQIISKGSSRSRKGFNGNSVHEWSGKLRGENMKFKMTSVYGHVMSLDFLSQYNNWDRVDPAELFQARTQKKESSPNLKMPDFLRTEARGCDLIILWLDCDKEGENICFEVIDCVLHSLNRVSRNGQILRAKFSAITEQEIMTAFNNLVEPNEKEAMSVDARQELDLRVGCAFTRFQTKFFQGKYGNLDSTLISYGPCQTPTLGFCVERHDRILSFVPEPFWKVDITLTAGEKRVSLEWERGRLFDKEVANSFYNLVRKSKEAVVKQISSKDKAKQRPQALNTVELLRVASSGLGISPHTAMQVAERLYTQGYISYPRTETTHYPDTFNLRDALRPQSSHPHWGQVVREILNTSINRPRKGHDAGDHPPITPMKSATPEELSGEAWRVYDYITRHFISTVMPDCTYEQTTVIFSVETERFSYTGRKMKDAGFTKVMSWLEMEDEVIPDEILAPNSNIPIENVKLYEGQTSPPEYLSESEVITLMEKHKIGTDASIPTHIQNICERNYVQVSSGRRLVPTTLGIVLVHGYKKIDAELVLPHMRAAVEEQLDLIARGKADYNSVLSHALNIFAAKFQFFVSNINNMDELFEVSFSPLAESGKPLSRCGKCRRYMKLVSVKPQRLFCATCDEAFSLPANGTIKIYKEYKCPLDDFELVLWTQGALILLKELSARPLNREELKFRIGVLHTCMVSLRRWLEVGGRKRALRNPPSMVGNPETVMHPIVQDITSTPHASLDDEDLPDGVCRILSRAPIQFPPRSTPELLNNARSIETPQTFPELITDDAELRDLIRQALDGYQTRVNLLGNDVVSRSNKLVILVKRVAAALSEEEIKSTLENGAKELTEVSARLLEAVDLVVHGDTTAISTMYECANHWTSLLTELQSNLLPLLEPWMSIVNPVIQNAEGGQFQELPYALSEFSACWGRLDFVFKELELAIDKSFVDPSAHQCVRAIEADRRQMEEEAKQLSDEANKVVVNNVSLRGAAESWSASALCLHLDLVRLFRILTLGSSLSGLKNSPQLRPNQVERVSRYCLLESGRMYAMKEDLSRVERGSKHEMNRLEEGIQNVNQILSILDSEQRSVEAAITDGVRLGSIERYWTVACQIIAEGTTFDHFVDRIVEEFSKPGLRLIGAGIAANSDPDEASNDYYVLRQHFTSKWIEARGEILSIIEDTDMNLRAEIRVVTDELGSLSSRLTDQTDTLCHVCTEDGMKECLTTTRRWACKMDLLINALLLGHGNRAKISVLVKQLCASLSHIRMEYYENIAQRKWTEFRHSNLIHNERETGVNTHRLPTKLKRKSSQPSRTENPNPIRFPRITNSTTFDKIASVLEHATDKWEDDQNEIVQVAKEMSRKLSDLLGYMRGEGPLQTRDELLFNAREIATDASQMIDFAKIIAKFATSEEFRQRLNCQANLIAMPAAQLSIVARVKESFSLDSTSVRQVATTAENLMRAVAHTLQAAEACCVHGLNATGASPVEKEALAVTSRWVSRLQHHYRRQASQSRVDDLGLRRISLNQAAPNLSDMFLQR